MYDYYLLVSEFSNYYCTAVEKKSKSTPAVTNTINSKLPVFRKHAVTFTQHSLKFPNQGYKICFRMLHGSRNI